MAGDLVDVLVVEDDPGHAQLMIRAFAGQKQRFCVVTVATLREATAFLSNRKPDVAVVDLHLPDGKGADFLRNRTQPADFPVIMMSSQGDDLAAAAAIKQGAWDYLVKSQESLLGLPKTVERVCREWQHVQERERAEKRLRTSEAIFRRVIESASGVPYRLRLSDSTYEFVGEGIEALLDIPHEQFSYEKLKSCVQEIVILDPQAPRNVREYGKAFAEGETSCFRADLRVLKPDGTERWLSDTAVPFRDPETGKITASLGILQDITYRKKAEAALTDSELRFAEVLSFLPDATLVIDDQGTVIAWNRAMEELTGISETDILGRGDYAYAIPFYGHKRPLLLDMTRHPLEEIKQLYSSVRREGDTLIAECFAPTLRGGCHLWCKATPLYDSSGNIVGAIESVRDVTEGLEARQALKESEEKYRTLVENVYDGIAINQGGTFIYSNEQFAAMLGYERKELLTKDYREIFAPEGLETLDTRQKARSMGQVVPSRYETKMLRKDGAEIDVEANVKIINYKGEPTSFAVFRDITQRKKFEAEIQQAQKMESLGILAGGIAHDFNNLLVGILGNASLSLKEIPSHSPARRCLQQIERSAQRAADLTNQLLAYSGRGKIATEAVNLTQLVEEMIGLLEMSISKNAVLHHRFASEMPSVHGDATQLRQIVMNLITNASESLEDSQGVISIRTGTQELSPLSPTEIQLGQQIPEDVYAFLEVSDTGCGMEPELVPQIFDPFFTTKFAGRGLGLASVLGIVKSHGGAMRVETEPGKGATFRVLLPCATGERIVSSTSQEDVGNWLGSGTILVIDDEEVVRLLAEQALSKSGFRVLAASDGEEGVQIFRDHCNEIAAIILDLTMPGLSGKETAQKMLEISRDARIIISSGYTRQDVLTELEQTTLAGFIQKPYRSDDLLATLKQVLESAEQQ